jgi:diaminobutyrate-2-oxoglutarate transaminase
MNAKASHSTFHRLESGVRSYSRSFPVVFETARGCKLTDEHGSEYLDFFAGAGALNYGHNPPELKAALIDYLSGDGITHSLDMFTAARRQLLETIEARLLAPRGLRYKVLTPGPTGTNAVEAAMKLARKATGRTSILGFTNGFHGMTLGSLSITGNQSKRGGAGVPLNDTVMAPYCGDMGGDGEQSLRWLEMMLSNPSSGMETPAAVVVECIQGEGGARAATDAWLKGLRELTRKHGVLLIVDDIQAGCGRSGDFFSFESAGIVPDMVTLSKSLSGMGLPLSLVLVKEEHDVFHPGEHNGTFRGFNPAFVTAAAAMERYWSDDRLVRHVRSRSHEARRGLERMAKERGGTVSGRGLMLGLRFPKHETAGLVAKACFARGMVIETAGAHDEVLKLLPPLVITQAELARGLDIIRSAVEEVLGPVVSQAGESTSGEVHA